LVKEERQMTTKISGGALAGTLCVLLGTAVAAQADPADDVKIVLDRMIRAWETGDVVAVDAIMAKDEDAVWFGTDAAERFVGYDPVKASLVRQFATYQGTKLQVKERSVALAASGTVAWATEVIDLTTRSGSESVTLSGVRVSSVLEKRQGRWLLVHFHYSVPVTGQAIKY
jgi:uncharacterized protein (TIGR02246 family)